VFLVLNYLILIAHLELISKVAIIFTNTKKRRNFSWSIFQETKNILLEIRLFFISQAIN